MVSLTQSRRPLNGIRVHRAGGGPLVYRSRTDSRRPTRDVRDDLPPVVRDAFLRDPFDRHRERRAGIVAHLDCDVSQREEHRVLVGRSKLALAQQRMNVQQKSDLLAWTRLRRSAPSSHNTPIAPDLIGG